MRRPICILLLSFLLAATAWSLWLAGDLVEAREPPRTVPPTVSTPRDAPRYHGDVQLWPMPGESRRELVAQRDAAAATADRGLVRVHGQVRQAGRPVANYDLVFKPLDDGRDVGQGDWDFTDSNGRYEVLLPAAAYAILNDDEGPCLWNVVVPRNKAELVLDLDLPPGW